MAKTRPPYPPELRRRLGDLVRAGRTPEALAEEFEPTEQSMHKGYPRRTATKEGAATV